MGTEALHDLTPAYAVDALDGEERRAYEAHLARCDRCRNELASLSDAASSLAYAVDAPPPPPQLRERILAHARAERPNVVPLRPRWALPAAATAVVAVAATVALAIWVASLSNRLDRARTARSHEQRVAAVLASPDARTFAGGRAKVVVAPGGDAALIVRRLDRARPGTTYEAWVAQGGAPQPAGLFGGGGDVTAVPLDRPVRNGATVMVTVERAGGTDAPTQHPFVTVRTQAQS